MAYDRNPKFGADASFSESARRTADLLWEGTRGDLSAVPRSYLENLRYEFADGKVSMLELIDRVDLGEGATYDDYVEVVEALMNVDPEQWPDADSVLRVKTDELLYEIQPEFSEFEEFDFAESDGDIGSKVELFLKKVISSVYTDGVTDVTDSQGNPPNMANRYLMSEDGTSFSGIFYDAPPGEEAKKFEFEIKEGSSGKWQIRY